VVEQPPDDRVNPVRLDRGPIRAPAVRSCFSLAISTEIS
jgi:hypothetical protein